MPEDFLASTVFSGAGVKTNPNIGKQVVKMLPKNPADKSTIVSVFPRDIVEVKPGVFPGKWIIPASEREGFSLFYVEPSSYFIKHQIDNMPPTEVQINSAQLADSIVNDYFSAIYLASRGIKGPGIFWIPGMWTVDTIQKYEDEITRKSFKVLLGEARARQLIWMKEIVDEADTFWARSHGNPRTISQDAFMAAEYLQVKGKPWLENMVATLLNPCKACGEMINYSYPVCKYCHAVIDAEKAKELNIQFANQ